MSIHPVRSAVRAAILASLLTGCSRPAPSTVGAMPVTDSTTPPATAPTHAPPPAVPANGKSPVCDGHDLTVTLRDPSSAKFQQAVTLVLTNQGTVTCTVSGYPWLRFSADGRALPITTVTDGATGVTVTLAPGKAAESLLTWNKYEGQGTTCTPVPTDVTVTPPSRTVGWIADADSASVCGGTVHARAFTPRA